MTESAEALIRGREVTVEIKPSPPSEKGKDLPRRTNGLKSIPCPFIPWRKWVKKTNEINKAVFCHFSFLLGTDPDCIVHSVREQRGVVTPGQSQQLLFLTLLCLV